MIDITDTCHLLMWDKTKYRLEGLYPICLEAKQRYILDKLQNFMLISIFAGIIQVLLVLLS